VLEYSHYEQQECNDQQATIEYEHAIAEPFWQAENVGCLTTIGFQVFGVNCQGTSPIIGNKNDYFDRE